MNNEQTILIAAIYTDKQFRMAPATLTDKQITEAVMRNEDNIYAFVSYKLQGIGGLAPDKMFFQEGKTNEDYTTGALKYFRETYSN